VYGPSGLLAVVQNPGGSEQVEYTTADHLGTPRVITLANGTLQTRHDYFPFGGAIPNTLSYLRTSTTDYPSNSHNVRQEFTCYEWDVETQLDFAQARYFGSTTGRFTSVDPLLASGVLENPKTWNRYTYALNNPVLYTDPSGMTAASAWPRHPMMEFPAPADPISGGSSGMASRNVTTNNVYVFVAFSPSEQTTSVTLPDGTEGKPMGAPNFDSLELNSPKGTNVRVFQGAEVTQHALSSTLSIR
jgi:RHS repeat-associated protein